MAEATPVVYNDYESLPVYKTSFAYVLIGQRGEEQLAMSLMVNKNELEIRFCLLTDIKPELELFQVRSGSKGYTYDKTKSRKGYALDKYSVQVFRESFSYTPNQWAEALTEIDAFNQLAAWVYAAMEKEHFAFVMESKDDFPGLFSYLFGVKNSAAPMLAEFVLPTIGEVPMVKQSSQHAISHEKSGVKVGKATKYGADDLEPGDMGTDEDDDDGMMF